MEICLSDKRYEELKRIVVEMYEKHNITCVPISGFEIASKMGIKVMPYSSFPTRTQTLMNKKSKDGFFIEQVLGDWYIFYNDAMDYGRINNTIMHEIGHIVLDHTEDSELAEKEVKFFAKFALAPPALLHKFQVQNPEDVVRIFDISYEAAFYAFSYYRKWLRHGDADYTDYEQKLLDLFSLAS